MNIEREAKRLVASGYRCTSNRYRIFSRIDRPDWREHMAHTYTKGRPDREQAERDGREWVACLDGDGLASDFYRRRVSKDKIELSPALYDAMCKYGGKSQCGDFLPLCDEAPQPFDKAFRHGLTPEAANATLSTEGGENG